MVYVLAFVHTVVSIFLIMVVLLQRGKGADVAAAFGGSSQTAFGARGASTALSKMTTISAVLFMLTSLFLSLLSTSGGKSVLEAAPASQSSTPVGGGAPATPPAQPGAGAAPAGGTNGQPSTSQPAAPQPANPPAPAGPSGQGNTPPPGGGK